ncbi:MAG: type II secretion system protein GspG [Verrucomicrobiota bacterium]|jgi:type II secretory pathway pseudopilin PulG
MPTGELKSKKQALAKRTVLIVCIGLPGLVLAGFLISGPIRRHSKAQNDVNALMQALSAYASEQGELPHGDCATICRLLRGESVDGQNPKRLDYINAEGKEVSAHGELLDPWGKPYKIIVEKGLRVYSSGPNGNDERGQGDDVTPK